MAVRGRCSTSCWLRASPLADAYLGLARAEARHHGLFFRLARALYPFAVIDDRAAFLLDYEAALVARLPHRAAVH